MICKWILQLGQDLKPTSQCLIKKNATFEKTDYGHVAVLRNVCDHYANGVLLDNDLIWNP